MCIITPIKALVWDTPKVTAQRPLFWNKVHHSRYFGGLGCRLPNTISAQPPGSSSSSDIATMQERHSSGSSRCPRNCARMVALCDCCIHRYPRSGANPKSRQACEILLVTVVGLRVRSSPLDSTSAAVRARGGPTWKNDLRNFKTAAATLSFAPAALGSAIRYHSEIPSVSNHQIELNTWVYQNQNTSKDRSDKEGPLSLGLHGFWGLKSTIRTYFGPFGAPGDGTTVLSLPETSYRIFGEVWAACSCGGWWRGRCLGSRKLDLCAWQLPSSSRHTPPN